MCTRIPRIQLSDNVEVDLHVPEHSKDVQRAVSISDQGIFVSIDGPQEQLEELLDCPPTSLDGSERGLQVNSKLWELLRQGEQNACDAMEKRVRGAVKDNPELDLVLCGHGLGGALALLAAEGASDGPTEPPHPGAGRWHLVGPAIESSRGAPCGHGALCLSRAVCGEF